VQTTTPQATRAGYIVPVVTVDLLHPLGEYVVHTDQLVRRLRTEVNALVAATGSGSMAASRSAWLTAHMTWLDIGQDDDAYGAFGSLGEEIDGLADGLPNTTSNPDFTGFHKIELDLWRRDNVTAASHDSARLLKLVDALTPSVVSSDLPGTALALDGWVLRAHEILEDALRDSLSGDDDYGSNSEMASLSADVNATREMLRILAPLIRLRAPQIVPEARVQLTELDQAIAAAGGPRLHRNLGALPLRQRQLIDADTSAALETLAPISELMQVTAPGS
jgi:high-affinity iron transporter